LAKLSAECEDVKGFLPSHSFLVTSL